MDEPTVYRKLKLDEIRALEEARCCCADWSKVLVAQEFRPGRLYDCVFGGQIRLGAFEGTHDEQGIRPSGIYSATLIDCTVGNHARIARVGRQILRTDIGSEACIEDVGYVAAAGESACGNGVEAAVMIEAGGRPLPLFESMSAQTAWVLTFCRNRVDVTGALRGWVAGLVQSRTGTRTVIGDGARVFSCRRIVNCRVGSGVVLEGVDCLENATVAGGERPAKLGIGVIAREAIVAGGATIESGAELERVFVGQGVRLEKGFSAQDSVFFANCDCARGEAGSVFAGPFTTSHHRSTLLLTELLSFYNAGSGTNSSNHMYKLGPVHQGVLERGCKTGSGSYCLWPSRVGLFTTVVGCHKRHLDTTDFPFSLLVENERGESVLLPGATLFAVGPLRDEAKWRKRDRRPSQPLDLYRVEIHTPLTVGRMIRARDILAELHTHTPMEQECVPMNGVLLPRARLHRAWRDYNYAISLYLGEKFACCAETVLELSGLEGLEQRLLHAGADGRGEWLDVAGLPVPKSSLDVLLDRIAEGLSLNELNLAWQDLHERYAEFEWNWVLEAWLSELGKEPDEISRDDMLDTLLAWQDGLAFLARQVEEDAAKEFSDAARIGYGLAGDAEGDFAAVRGSLEENAFLQAFRERIERDRRRAGELLRKLAR